MQIKLNIDGKEKTFDTGKQTADAVFKAAEFEDDWKKITTSLGRLKAMTAQVVEMYGNQFTEQDIRDGLGAEEFGPVMLYQCFGVGEKVTELSTVKND